MKVMNSEVQLRNQDALYTIEFVGASADGGEAAGAAEPVIVSIEADDDAPTRVQEPGQGEGMPRCSAFGGRLNRLPTEFPSAQSREICGLTGKLKVDNSELPRRFPKADLVQVNRAR